MIKIQEWNVFKLYATNLAFASTHFYYTTPSKNFYYDTDEEYFCKQNYELSVNASCFNWYMSMHNIQN